MVRWWVWVGVPFSHQWADRHWIEAEGKGLEFRGEGWGVDRSTGIISGWMGSKVRREPSCIAKIIQRSLRPSRLKTQAQLHWPQSTAWASARVPMEGTTEFVILTKSQTLCHSPLCLLSFRCSLLCLIQDGGPALPTTQSQKWHILLYSLQRRWVNTFSEV